MSLPTVRTTIAVGTVLRLVVAATTGLGIDESYAVAVNRPLSLSYFDHPPLVFWWSAAAEALVGSRHPLVVRLPFVLAFAATLALLATAARRLHGESAARATVLVASLAGVIGVTGATWVLPDGPLFLGLALAALGASRALLPAADGSPVDQTGWWLVGVGAGVAALAKYHAIFLPIGLLAFLVTTGRVQVLASWRPWVAGLVAFTMALPVFAWNVANGWASFRFQGARAAPTGAWSPAPLAENVLGQAAWILPWVWVPLVWAAWRAWRRGSRDAATWFWLCLALGPLVAFTGSALLGRRGLPHWQAPGYLMLTPLLGMALADAYDQGRTWARMWTRWATAATVGVATLLATQVRLGWLPLAPGHDPTRDAIPWDAAAAELGAHRASLEVTHWMDGAKLGASLPAGAPLPVLADDARHFRFRSFESGASGAIIVRAASRGAMDTTLQERVGAVDTLPPIVVRRRGIAMDTLYRFRRRQRPGV